MMDDMPKVSIIIPVYNVEKYLRACLDSVVNQTLKDIEIICVDDGSTDSSPAILAEYAAKDPRVKVITRPKSNAGAARNAGMAVATGEYLGFVDSDDWCELTLFEKAYAKAKTDDADVALWRYDEFDVVSGRLGSPHRFPDKLLALKCPFSPADMGESVFYPMTYAPWGRIVRRSLVEDAHLFFQAIPRSNDVYFGCMVQMLARRQTLIDEALYHYRIGMATNLQSGNAKTPASAIDAWAAVANALFEQGLFERFRHAFAFSSAGSFFYTLGVMDDPCVCTAFYGRLRALYAKHPVFSQIATDDIGNDQMSRFLGMLRSNESFIGFLVQQQLYYRRSLGNVWRTSQDLRQEIGRQRRMAEEQLAVLTRTSKELAAIRNSWSYRIGKMVTTPVCWARSLLNTKKGETVTKEFRKGLKLLLPTGYMRWRLKHVFGYEPQGVSESAVVCTVVDFLPYAIYAILSQRQSSDRRPIKYFLPYSKVREYVEGSYGKGHVRYKDVSGWVGRIRKWLPYGLVQWWDFGDASLAASKPKAKIDPRARARFMDRLARAKCEMSESVKDGEVLVSVVVPAYNVEKYLSKTLDSLVGQTLKAMEIIVVDDGSTDSTPQICDAYAARHDNVRVIHQRNGGLSAARNAGMVAAVGKYLGFVDGDDFVDGEMFETLAAMLEMDPLADFSRCGVKVEFKYRAKKADRLWAQRYFDFDYIGSVDLVGSPTGELDNTAVNKLYRREALIEQGIRFPAGFKNEDVVFSFFLMGKSSRMIAIDTPYYHYIRNDGGIMARQKQDFAEDGALPDSLTKTFPLLAEYLLADDRRDLLGAFFRRLCGAANGFKSEAAAKCVSRILRRVGYFYNREFLNDGDLGWVRNQLSFYSNFDFSDLPPVTVDRGLFPKLRPQFARCEQPLVSVVIPVFNQELYLTWCLESVRKQSLTEIEIICIDDGSTDNSWRLLEDLAAADGRIRLIRQENAGAAAARNRGIREARGKYAVFVDADDWVEKNYLSETLGRMERDALDMCLIDLECFDYCTRKRIDHAWSLRKNLSYYPSQSVFTFVDLRQYRCMTVPWSAVWRRGFLDENGLEFPAIRNGEDAVFWMRAMPIAKRIGLVNKVFYHYRRGNPNSAVSRLHSNSGASRALETVRCFVNEWERLRPRLPLRAQAVLAGRIALEMSYHARIAPDVIPFLQAEGFERLNLEGVQDVAKTAPNWKGYVELRKAGMTPAEPSVSYREGFSSDARRLIEAVEAERKTSVKDLYLITGQLNSTANAPIDSWTFFKWLQAQGIPSRYVIWKRHEWYPRLEREGELKDVIALDGNGVDDYEFLFKCRDVLPRCRVFAQENGVLNWRIRKWFYHLPECPYVFLEHGIKYWKYTDKLGTFFSSFNVINNSSTYEKELLERDVPGYVDDGEKPTCIVGGLPRFDTFADERDPNRQEFTVFVMLTWRSTFNAGQSVLEKSAYYQALKALLSPANLERLGKARITVKVSAHHHLVNRIKELSFGESVEIVPQSDVAYWKSHADCCLTDYSSIAFDFLFLDKPAIFWILDREDPILNQDDYNELVVVAARAKEMINVCDSAASVISLLEKYAARRFELEPEKKSAVAKFFDHRTCLCGHLYAALEAEVKDA